MYVFFLIFDLFSPHTIPQIHHEMIVTVCDDVREGLLQSAQHHAADILVVGSRGLSAVNRYFLLFFFYPFLVSINKHTKSLKPTKIYFLSLQPLLLVSIFLTTPHRWVLGSVSHFCVTHAEIPVLVVPPPAQY
jgi:hypothetical protein